MWLSKRPSTKYTNGASSVSNFLVICLESNSAFLSQGTKSTQAHQIPSRFFLLGNHYEALSIRPTVELYRSFQTSKQAIMKCGSPVECQRWKNFHEGCVRASNRNASPATKEILGLLTRQVKVALEHGQRSGSGRLCIIRADMKNREADGITLERYDLLSQMGDYASVLCHQLKQVKGVSFKEMYWIQIVSKLDAEV